MKPIANPLEWIDTELDALERAHLLRELPQPLEGCHGGGDAAGAVGGDSDTSSGSFTMAATTAAEHGSDSRAQGSMQGVVIQIDGRELVNFASNDYLSLAADSRLVVAAVESCRADGVGRGASPLVVGRGLVHDRLECQLAQFEQTEAALLFPSGYAVNAGVIPALVDRGDVILGDVKNHASLIDGCRLSHAEKHVYPHANMESLERRLKQSMHFRRRLIVTDTLFSMDGDLAPLPQLAQLADRYRAILMVDEAHATGVLGKHGRGAVEQFVREDPHLKNGVHVRVGTLSKALGSAGGFVCGSESLICWLANRARTYVFSTAHPAALSAAALEALAVVRQEPERRQRVLSHAAWLRKRLQEQGWNTGRSVCQIVPIVIGSPVQTMQLAGQLRDSGFLVPGIRPPSVSAGESMLRISICHGHSMGMLEDLLQTFHTLRQQIG
jgi:8-amino-7-oxononanoate synthase